MKTKISNIFHFIPAILLLFLICTNTFCDRKIYIMYNGEKGNFTDIKLIKDVEYISVKDISDVCMGQISWHGVSGKLVMRFNGHNVGFFYGTKRVSIDEKRITLKNQIKLISNKVYVPLYFWTEKTFTEMLAISSNYNPRTATLEFNTLTNIYYPRIYSEKGCSYILFEFAKPLSYKLITKKRISTLTFYKGKVDEDKINYNDKYIRSITLRNQKKTAICEIEFQNEFISVEDVYDPEKMELKIIVGEKTIPVDSEKELVKSTTVETTLNIEKSTEIVLSTVDVSTISEIPLKNEPVEYKKEIKQTPEIKFIKKIVLDPGHGGEDSGAIGPNGTLEKDINLEIAKGLEKILSSKGYEVFLTRDSDVFVPLVDRTNFANEKKADIFISIHCNASPNINTKGFEIFFLSEKATDKEAAEIAAFENAVIKLEKKPSAKKLKLQEILWSMVVNEFMNESSELCGYITNEVTKRIDIENRGIKQASFIVLKGAQMPAVLVECGFISNIQEEARLRTDKFKKQIIDSIYSGIREYDYYKSMHAKSSSEIKY